MGPPVSQGVGRLLGVGRDRFRDPFVAQGTWRSGALHVWGWNGVEVAPTAWLYSGFRRIGLDGAPTGWHDSPISYGAVGRVVIDPPESAALYAASVQLDPFNAAVWLSELPPPGTDQLSDSLAWFARVAELARRMVDTDRITPVIRDEGPFTIAAWEPVVDAETGAVVEQLRASMPALCTLGATADVTSMLEQFVDGIARTLLHRTGWKPDLGRQRKPEVQALRATFTSLARPDRVVRGGTDEFAGALTRLRHELDRYRARRHGEPVVVPRLRLLISDDPLDPWGVRLELVDEGDNQRWCTAADIVSATPLAVDLANGESRLGTLHVAAREAAERIADLPGLADLAAGLTPPAGPITAAGPGTAAGFERHPGDGRPGEVELPLDLAEDFLDIAPVELHRMGIELLGPERLVRRRPAVSGEARAAPQDDRTARFSAEAIVEWNMVVDGDEVSDDELARVAEAGATLLFTGHRWVRIDPDELRRKRAELGELRAERDRLTPLQLLQLANGDDSTDDQPQIAWADGGEDGEDDAVGDRHDEVPDLVSSRAAVDERQVDAALEAFSDLDWVRGLLHGLPDEELAETIESSLFVGELRHYQRRGLSWMQLLARLGLGGCLADDMGLGKTATTLAHLVERPGPHLVVCPLSVVRNWRSEAGRFTPKLDVVVHHGANRTKADNDADELFAIDRDRQLVITTYGLLPRDLEHLSGIDWNTVVLDEAQMVKNPNTKAAKAVRRLSAEQKLALTGTPVENRLSELWAILDAVNPGILGGLAGFRERFGTPIERRGDVDAAARLRRLTQPFVLRRTKADKRLLPDLPDKIEQVAYAKLTKEQATLYQGVVDQLLQDAERESGMRRRGLVLAALMRLKQICNHPAHALKDGSRLEGRSGKLSRFDELVSDLLERDERALVFTQFREMGDLLTGHLETRFDLRAPFLHGGVSRSGRDRMVDGFQDGSAPPLLIVSLKAGGTGLNLTAASQVIHYDRWWNPAVEDQATDRAWRIGQRRTVNVHKLVCEGTVEERIGAVIDDKRKLADAVVGNSEAWLSELSTDELRDLVVLGDDDE